MGYETLEDMHYDLFGIEDVAMDIVIRQSTIADWRIIAKYETEYTALERASSPKNIQSMVRLTLPTGRAREDYIIGIFIVEYEGSPIGMFRIKIMNVENMSISKLTSLFIENTSRRLGAGSAVMKFVENYSRDNNCTAITLSMRFGNTAAKSLYTSAGYDVYSESMMLKL